MSTSNGGRSRSLRPGLKRAAVVLTSAGLAVTTLGAAPGTAYTGTRSSGPQPVTNGPDLVSATLTSGTTTQLVTYCFDATIHLTGSASSFRVKTYDADRYLVASTAAVDTSARCVNASFPTRFDLARIGSVAEAAGGAVAANGTNLSGYFSSIALSGSALAPRAGQTTGPDLLSVSIEPGSNGKIAIYNFDQNLADVALTASRFGTVRANGTAGPRASSASVVGGSSVKATFGETVSGVASFYVGHRAVQTPKFTGIVGEKPGPDGATPGDARHRGPAWSCGLGAATTNACFATPGAGDTVPNPGVASVAPVLVSVERTGAPGQFKLNYSTDFTPAAAGKISAVFDNGNYANASRFVRIAGSTTSVIADFDGTAERASDAVVRIVSSAGAGTGTPISSAPLPAAPMRPGLTNGPDLLSTALNAATSQASFHFDEAVTSTAAASAFRLLEPSAQVVTGSNASLVSVGSPDVVVTFPTTVRGAAAVFNTEGAVKDALGNPAPFGSVSTAVTPPTTPPPPTVRKAKVRISLHVHRHKLKGKVTSKPKMKACYAKRVVKLKRGHRTIAKTRTGKRGGYHFRVNRKIHRKAHGKRVRVVVYKKRPKPTLVCGKDHSARKKLKKRHHHRRR